MNGNGIVFQISITNYSLLVYINKIACYVADLVFCNLHKLSQKKEILEIIPFTIVTQILKIGNKLNKRHLILKYSEPLRGILQDLNK